MNAASPRMLRRHCRAARRAISPPAQRIAARQLLRRLRPWVRLAGSRRVAAYRPFDGEIDPGPVTTWLAGLGATVCLPVIRRDRRLDFAAGRARRRNRFGIAEPARHALVAAWSLDLVLVPLVGFDATGHRLGMGGGYYDRTFARTATAPALPRPLLVGLAHDCQQVDALPVNAWDVRLDAVATPTRLLWFGRPRRGGTLR